jgi:chromosome partitioning protein
MEAAMRTIMVLNAKGGSGKTTLATNLAAHYAAAGKSVVLADFDPQGSSLAWLKVRPEDRPSIGGVAAWQEPPQVPRDTDYVVMDAPSGSHGSRLTRLLRYTQTVVIPVLPSPLDIRAAADFIQELKQVGELTKRNLQAIDGALDFLSRLFAGNTVSTTRLAVVANRVRENTLAYETLEEFLDKLKVPFLTSLRDTQNYIQAAERGLGLAELAPSQVASDLELWEPLIKWLNSKRSLPA